MVASSRPATQETPDWREEHPQAVKGEEKGQSSPLHQAYPTGSRGGRKDSPSAPPHIPLIPETLGRTEPTPGSLLVQNEKERLQSRLLESWMMPI